MKATIKKGISLILSFALLFSTFSFAAEAPKHWAQEQVEKAKEKGIIEKGVEDLHLDQSASRAEAVQMINRVFGFSERKETGFTDIQNHPAKEAIEIAFTAGYIKGTSATTFSPEMGLTREQEAVMLYRAFGFAPVEMPQPPFKDWDQIADWAKEAVAALADRQILKGYPGGEFKPQAGLTKAQAISAAVAAEETYQAIKAERAKPGNVGLPENAKPKPEAKRPDSGTNSGTNQSQPPLLPLPDESLTNPMKLRQAAEQLFVVSVNEGEDFAKIRQDILTKYSQIKEENLHLAKIFKDSRKVLAYIEQTGLYFPELPMPEETVSGFYALTGKDFALLEDSDAADRQDCLLVVGQPERKTPIAVGRKILGYPQNSLTVGLDLNKETVLVRGLNFNLSKAPKEALVMQAAITQSGRVTENPSNLTIAQNRIDMGEDSEAVKNGIRLMIPVAEGELRIERNIITGSGDTKGKSRSAEAISLSSRAKADTKVVVKDNQIKDYKFHAIGITAGKDSAVEISGNHLQNIGQNGIGVFVFDTLKDLTIKNNRIDSYGTKEIKSGAFGTEPKVSAESETGISLEYIDMVYGVKVNQKYYSQAPLLAQDLAVLDNQVADKAKNDALDGVLNCTPVFIGQRGKFGDPVQALNSRTRLHKKDVIVVKSEDDEMTLGVNPSDPAAARQVKSLYLTGNGSGRVVLSENLEILEDLTIDLPNAMVQNKAKVKGNVHILNVRDNDASSFRLTVAKDKIFKHNSEDIALLLEDIKNQKGQDVTKEQSNLAAGLRLFDGKKELAKESYEILDAEDKIILKKELLNTLKESTSFAVEYSDPQNQVQRVKKSFTIAVEDYSTGKLSFTGTSEKKIICAFAPAEGIQIQVSDLKNIMGEAVSAGESRLTGNLEVAVSYLKAAAEDFEVDEEKDIITLKKGLLDKVPTPAWGSTQPIKLTVKDAGNKIDEIKLTLELGVVNYSIDQGTVTGKTPLTFTEGNALPTGLIFEIKGLKNAKGDVLTAAETDLTNYLEIEPFPVDWQLEMEGSGENIHFNPAHYEIDDANDTITLKKAYLDLIKANKRDTEYGVKQYIFKYRDPRLGTEFRSKKVLVHIKKQLIPLNTQTKITSDTLQISESGITSGQTTLTADMTVREFLAQIKRGNPRQTLRLYRPAELTDGKLPEQNWYHYKNEYENIEDGDVLVVTAEDGKSRAYYPIHFAAAAEEAMITGILDAAIVAQLGGNFIRVKGEQTVDTLLGALSYAPEVERSVLKNDNPVAGSEIVQENMILRLKKGEKVQNRVIKVVKKPVYRALIVANSDYPGEKSDLVGPVGDAKLMNRVFAAQNFTAGKMKSIMVKENLKKVEFFDAIRQAYAGANENDISYFYYSGHGYNKDGISYLCMVEAPLGGNDPLGLWVSVNELRAALDQVPGTKVLILDSCNSGGFIGKSALDGSSSATPTTTGAYSRDFVETVMQEFKTEAASPNYLIGNEYKVLAASSENEFSYEDKLEKLGKFTKILAEAAGKDGDLKADANGDNKAGLEELYDYLDKNVIYTSHIQAYPRQDSFVIFEAPEASAPESDNVDVSAKENAYKVTIRGKARMISKGKLAIDTDMTVEEFLSHIQKGEEHQQLAVVKPAQFLGGADREKDLTEKMEVRDRLKVTAQNGRTVQYSIIVKPASTPKPPKPASPAAIELPDFGGKYKLSYNKKSIVGDAENLTESTEVGTFLAALTNRAAYDEVKVLKAYTADEFKQDSDKLENEDKLFLRKGNEKATYMLQVESGGLVVPPAPGGLRSQAVLNSRILRQELLSCAEETGQAADFSLLLFGCMFDI